MLSCEGRLAFIEVKLIMDCIPVGDKRIGLNPSANCNQGKICNAGLEPRRYSYDQEKIESIIQI